MTDAASAPLRVAWGWGLASIHSSGQVLDTYFPSPRSGRADGSAAPVTLISAAVDDEAREVRTEVVHTEIDLDAPPVTTSDAYLRLHLLSHRLVRPRSMNLDGIFSSLPNVVWTSAGPCAIEGFERVRTRLRARGGHLTIFGVDKFPRMVDYVVPTGVRIGTPIGCGWAPISPRVRPSCMRALSTSMPARSAHRWWKAESLLVWWLAATPTWAVELPSWVLCPAAALKSFRLASVACSAPTPVSGSPWATIASSRRASTSPRAPGSLAGRRGGQGTTLSGENGLLFIRNSVTGAVELRRRQRSGVELNAELHAN